MKKTILILLVAFSMTLRASEIIDLGDLGGSTTYPIAINDSGQILLESSTANGETHLAFYDNGALTDLNQYYGLDFDSFFRLGLNNRGDIACTIRIDNGALHQAAILSHGEVSILPLPSNYFLSAINNHRETVGFFGEPLFFHVFIYSRSGLIQPFGASGWTQPSGISNRGSICGRYSENYGGYGHAFVREASGAVTFLTSEPSEATAINDRDDVTGTAGYPGLNQGFIYRNRQLTFFGGDAWYTIPYAINNRGVVVGTRYYREIEEFRAFNYENGIISDLVSPSPEWHLELATGINNSGEIIGTYTVENSSQRRGFLLRP